MYCELCRAVEDQEADTWHKTNRPARPGKDKDMKNILTIDDIIDAGAGYPCWVCTNFNCDRRQHKKRANTLCQLYDLTTYASVHLALERGDTVSERALKELEEATELTYS